MASVANINDVLDGHVALEVECVDRLYLNAYVPGLQVGGQVVRFITRDLGKPIPSAALLGAIGNRFRRDVKRFADDQGIPILHLKKPDRTRWDDRKLDHVRPYLQAAERERRFGVVAIVACQEFQWVISARNRATRPKAVCFEFFREERRVGVYYFYICDPDFGPGFIKICTYFPYPAKVWLNGHEWAKRQADMAGVDYTALSNGFAACPQPERLQAICDSFSAQHVQWFFDRWIAQVPTPFTKADRDAGYWWELSMRQVEVSRTIVFDDPRRARAFFEALVADNIGIGRPEQIAIVFGRQVRKTTKGPFRTRVFDPGVDVKIDFSYKHSRIKQYLKDGRALRIEAVINKPWDLDVLARLAHLPELIAKARAINQRLLIIERAGQSCAIGAALRGFTRHGSGRRPAHPAARRHRLHQQKPSRARRRTPRPAIQRQQDELRPPPPTTARPHRTPPAQQHLRPHARRHPRRRLLQQTPKPPPAPAAGSRQTARPARSPPRPHHARTRRRRLRPQRPPRRMKLVTTSHVPATKKDQRRSSATSFP
jgi:hypothetical protein